MYLTHFAEMVLGLLIGFGGGAGNSPYSFEPVTECGSDPEKAACELVPSCPLSTSWHCAPPRWSGSRAAWVVPESKQAAWRRYQGIAGSIARVSFQHTRCKDEFGVVSESCQRSSWPEGPESLAMVLATTAINESGLREDIQFGYPPMGRGPDGEVCLLQIMPMQIVNFASWIPADEKRAWEIGSPAKKRELQDSWSAQMLGDSKEALDKCLDIGARMLARARLACHGRSPSWAIGMWSMYGTGTTCVTPGYAKDEDGALARAPKSFAEVRETMLIRMRRASSLPIPEEARKALGLGDPPAPGPQASGGAS